MKFKAACKADSNPLRHITQQCDEWLEEWDADSVIACEQGISIAGKRNQDYLRLSPNLARLFR